MNRYLVKIALNAQKARKMAESVGIIPDGAWKYALRNVRNGKGEVLQGEALNAAKEKLGDIRPGALKQILEHQERARLKAGIKDVEISGRVQGDKVDGLIYGDKPGSVKYRPSQNFHTHPGTKSDFERLSREMPTDRFSPDMREHLLANPSGASKQITTNNSKHFVDSVQARHELDSLYKEVLPIEKELIKYKNINPVPSDIRNRVVELNNSKMSILSDPILVNREGEILAEFKKKHLNRPIYSLSKDSDLFVFSHTKKPNIIVAPDIGVHSVSKFRPEGVRTVYFKKET